MVIGMVVLAIVVLGEGVVIWQLINRLLIQAKVASLSLRPAGVSTKQPESIPPTRAKVWSMKVPS